MSSQAPFCVKIFVVDGDPDGLLLVERSDWTGKAVMFPRALYLDVSNRTEFDQAGVYLLLGPRSQGDGEMLHVGEGDPVRTWLEIDYASKDFWTRAVVFVAPGQWKKAHVQYLETHLIRRGIAAGRMPLANANEPSEPTLSAAERADMDVLVDKILGMLPVLGIRAFEDGGVAAAKDEMPLLTCRGRGVKASGYDAPQGFVVQSGSFAARAELPSLQRNYALVCKMRANLLKSGVLVPDDDKLRFTQDYIFHSPSMASSVVLGRTSNGPESWRDARGRTVGELRHARRNLFFSPSAVSYRSE